MVISVESTKHNGLYTPSASITHVSRGRVGGLGGVGRGGYHSVLDLFAWGCQKRWLVLSPTADRRPIYKVRVIARSRDRLKTNRYYYCTRNSFHLISSPTTCCMSPYKTAIRSPYNTTRILFLCWLIIGTFLCPFFRKKKKNVHQYVWRLPPPPGLVWVVLGKARPSYVYNVELDDYCCIQRMRSGWARVQPGSIDWLIDWLVGELFCFVFARLFVSAKYIPGIYCRSKRLSSTT